MFSFFKKIYQKALGNINSTIYQSQGDMIFMQPPAESDTPTVFYISKKGIDLEPVELLTTRAAKNQGFNPYFYLHRPNVDEVLLHCLVNRKSAIVIGKPLAGKTRAVFQLAKNELAAIQFFLPTEDFISIGMPELPISTEKGIIVFDDINNYIQLDNEKNFVQFLKKALLEHTVVATCQKAKYNEIELLLQENNLMELFTIVTIPSLNTEQKEDVAQKTNKTIQDGDDTIGSFILPIEKMKASYKMLTELEKEILRSYKLLKFISKIDQIKIANVQNYCTKRLVNYYHKKEQDYSPAMWENAFQRLASWGFILRYNERISVEEIYLLSVIEPTLTEKAIAWELTTYQNDLITYNKVIQKVSNLVVAREIFAKQKKYGVKPDEFTYTTLLSKASDYLLGKEVLLLMKSDGVKPDAATLNILKQKVASQDANTVLRMILEDEDIKTIFEDEVTNYMIGCLIPHIDYIRFFEKYKKDIISSDHIILHYCYLLEKLNDSKANQIALDLAKAVKKQDANYFNLMGNCTKFTDLNLAIDFYKRAIGLSEKNKDKSKYCNNIGFAILNYKDESFYETGIDYCRKAITFHYNNEYAKDTLMVLLAKVSSCESLIEVLLNEIGTLKQNVRKSLPKLLKKLDMNNDSEKIKIELIQQYLFTINERV